MRIEGSKEEEENGFDTDRKYAMRVENHHPLPAGAIDLTSTQKLFHQWLLNQSESDKTCIFLREGLLTEEYVGGARATIYKHLLQL